jgi:hypothetical protein
MSRAGLLGDPQPYFPFGTFAGLPFWPGGLTLLAAAPGVGKTSWLLRAVHEAAMAGIPAALGCYEHTAEELKFRLRAQAQAALAGPHGAASPGSVEAWLARGGQAVLLALSDQEDTVRAIEDVLLMDYGFPERGPVLLALDYLQRTPVVGLAGMVPEGRRGGEAAGALRALGRRRGWAVLAACALRTEGFSGGEGLADLLGDERVAYEADRVLLLRRAGQPLDCGCAAVVARTLKDRTGPPRDFDLEFWGARFYPSLEAGGCAAGRAGCERIRIAENLGHGRGG